MKKGLIISFVLLCALTAGCGEKKAKYEEIMGDYAKAHYEKYMSGFDIDVPKVSISDLKNANAQINANYDLSKLEKCTDESYVNIIFKAGTKEVEKLEYHLECE